jgi:hypothetical protein
MLSQTYGSAKAAATLAKYGFSSLGGFVASPLKAIKRVNGEFEFDWKQPNLLDNPISAANKTTDPELFDVQTEGWKTANELNVFLDTFAQSVAQVGQTDPGGTGPVIPAPPGHPWGRIASQGAPRALRAQGGPGG